jgi:hypothetical protein
VICKGCGAATTESARFCAACGMATNVTNATSNVAVPPTQTAPAGPIAVHAKLDWTWFAVGLLIAFGSKVLSGLVDSRVAEGASLRTLDSKTYLLSLLGLLLLVLAIIVLARWAYVAAKPPKKKFFSVIFSIVVVAALYCGVTPLATALWATAVIIFPRHHPKV